MTSASFDFAPLLAPGLPPAAAKWTGFPKYNFIGGHNDAAHLPVDRLTAAATAVLQREGATLATYGLNSGPLGYRPLREFLVTKLKRDAGMSCQSDEILVTSGSLQAIDLVNGLLLARGDTVLIEQESYQGSLNRLTRLGVNAVGIPLDGEGMRMDALAAALADLKRRSIRPKYIYTIPTVQNPTGTIMGEARRAELLQMAETYDVPIFEDDCYADLIWDGRRPPALHAMTKRGDVIHIGSFSKSIAPALRVGYIVARWDLLSRMLALKTDAGSGALEQMVLAEFGAACAPSSRRSWNRSPSISGPPPSSMIPRAASSCGSSCRTRSTRKSLPRPRLPAVSPSIRGRSGRRTRPTAGAGCGSASPIRPRTRSAKASPRSPRSAIGNSACRSGARTWSSAAGVPRADDYDGLRRRRPMSGGPGGDLQRGSRRQ
jgi:Aminotransferase class I and II